MYNVEIRKVLKIRVSLRSMKDDFVDEEGDFSKNERASEVAEQVSPATKVTKTVCEINDSKDERNRTFVISSKNSQELVDGRIREGEYKDNGNSTHAAGLDDVAGTSGKKKKLLKREYRLQRNKGKNILY